ncbi:hypothetical protein BASA81_015757 [Batrachochytrium salamandrivorans]|nr:hypothetical protein BASA81_015757 [Batrachochytrium salamandrivorans]
MDCFGVARAIRQRLASQPGSVEDVLECQYSIQELLARPFLDPGLKVWLKRAQLVCKAKLGRPPSDLEAEDGRAVLISRIFFRSSVLDPVGEEDGEDARVVHWLKFTRAQALLDRGWCRSAAMVWQSLPTAEAQVNCGVAFGVEGNHALALEHFTQAMELGQSNSGFAKHESLVLLNAARAEVQSTNADSDLALNLYKLALSVATAAEEQDLCRVGIARILAARNLYAQAFHQLGNSNTSKPIVLQRLVLFLEQYRPGSGGALSGFTREYFCALPWQDEDVRFAWCHSQALLTVFDSLQESDRVLRDQVLPLTLELLRKDPNSALGHHYKLLLERRGII